MNAPSIHISRPQLNAWERLGIGVVFLGLILFGLVVEMRSARMQRRMTDLDVYLRAAWAVRTGADIYTITDDNEWHYHYPPLLAILLTPLADPPPGFDRTGMPSFAFSVTVWYYLGILCLIGAVQLLAGAIEAAAHKPEALAKSFASASGLCAAARLSWNDRWWWRLRIMPVLACLPPIGHSLMRGQVNLLLLLLLCGTAAATLRGRRWQSGWWLAGAICLKVFPAFLLIYPAWRRDWRCLVGCALGLVLGLGVIPALVFGPGRALAYYQEWDEVLRRPALAGGTDQSRAKELLEVTATDSQSYLAVIHNTMHSDRGQRPANPAAWVRLAHWLIGGALTGLTLLAGGRRRARGPAEEVVFFGALVVMMVLLSPVSHLHYFSLSLLLVMGMQAAKMQRRRTVLLNLAWAMLLLMHAIANTLPHLPELEALRDFGLAMYAGLLLWSIGCSYLVVAGRMR